jgi:GTP-binding protein
MQVSDASYLGSFASVKSCPASTLPEYAFVGRSNVGKSSLINMLTQKKSLARVSNSPGKTRTINLYQVNDWLLADLPGYGYARVGKELRQEWPGMIHEYLTMRTNLSCVFVLLDFRHSLQAIDRHFITMLGENNVPFALAYTKADKVHQSKHRTHALMIENALLEDWNALPPRFLTSAETQEGRDALLEYISQINTSMTHS